jgi:hypothetical protein
MKDHFSNASKSAYRQDCIAFLRNQAKDVLLTEEGFLRGKWVELAGASGYLSLEELVQAEVLPSGQQFIGIDDSQANVDLNRAKSPDATWLCNDLFKALKGLEDVSVVNLDGYRETDSRLGNHEVRYLRATIRNAVNRFGAFVLFYNTDLDSTKQRKRKASEALLAHTSAICEQLAGWFPEHYLETDDILNQEDALKLDEGHVGRLGEHYFIYRGNRHRMANLKLVFR